MLIGVDVGGTNLRVGVVDGITLVEERRIPADFSGICRQKAPEQAIDAVLSILSGALADALQTHPTVTAIGIGFPGFIDPGSGVVTQSPNLPGLRDVDLTRPLQARFEKPVILENDALAAAYGEYMLSGSSGGGLIYLGLGTGVGGGLIQSGRPFPGEHGVAMEVGHLIVEPGGRLCGCGNRGCMEQYASASGVTLTYGELGGASKTADEIARLAQAGDAAAISAYALAGNALAQALAHILKVADVGRVVIGGGMSQAWPLMVETFLQRLDMDLIPVLRGKVQVEISRAGDQAGMIGAAALAALQ